MTTEYGKFIPPTDEEIAMYAFHLWDAEGRQPGRDLDYWFQAKAHLTIDRQYEAGLLTLTLMREPLSEPAMRASV